MKRLMTALFLLVSVSAFSQNDTVMMNDRFVTPDRNQLYEIKSLRVATTDIMFSCAFIVAGAGSFFASSLFNAAHDDAVARQSPDRQYIRNLQSGQDFFFGLGITCSAVSFGFSIASVIDMRQPTTIRPVKVL